MTFKPGQSGNPGGRPSQKPFNEALVYLLSQPLSEGGKRIRLPKNPTVLHGVARQLIRHALNGDIGAINSIMVKMDGRVPLEYASDKSDAPIQERPPLDLREAARIVGFLLTSQAADINEEALATGHNSGQSAV